MNQLIHHKVCRNVQLQSISAWCLEAEQVLQDKVKDLVLDHSAAFRPCQLLHEEMGIHHQTHTERREGDGGCRDLRIQSTHHRTQKMTIERLLPQHHHDALFQLPFCQSGE